MKNFIKSNLIPIFDPLIALFALFGFSGLIARRLMSSSKKAMPITRWAFQKLGYLPIRDHYYEPLTFNAIGSQYRERIAQLLFNESKDFKILESIACPEEFKFEYTDGIIKQVGFRFNNGAFESGDAETLYYFVRGLKPKKIIEIGAGNSSILIHAALSRNNSEGKTGEHIIIEPYENSWLEKLGSQVIRERVERVDFSVFQSLRGGIFYLLIPVMLCERKMIVCLNIPSYYQVYLQVWWYTYMIFLHRLIIQMNG